jgi:hypothetical protein
VIAVGNQLLCTADAAHWQEAYSPPSHEGVWWFVGFTTPKVAEAIFQPSSGASDLDTRFPGLLDTVLRAAEAETTQPA